jgi:aspartate aminotransferase
VSARSVGDAALARVLAQGIVEAAIDLSGGEPDFPTPDHVGEAGLRAIREGETRYTPKVGLASLRELIVEKVRTRNGYTAAFEDVIVTGGGSPAVCIAIAASCTAGDNILVPDPGWPNYQIFAEQIGIECRRYRQLPSTPIDFEAIESLIDSRTRLLVWNAPSNPTGAMGANGEVETLVELAERHGLSLLSDEAYEDIYYEQPPTSPSALGGAKRTFGCYTFSKTYAMTGWRVGYVTVPPTFRNQAIQFQTAINGCASSISQRAAEAAIAGPQTVVEERRLEYRRRRDKIVQELLGTQLLDGIPEGAFYLWLDVSASRHTGASFTAWLAEQTGILVSAGEVYSTHTNHHIRVSFAEAEELVVDALRQIRDGVEALSTSADSRHSDVGG